MSSTPIYGSTGRRNSGRSRARTAQRSIDEHADSLTGQAAGGSVPMPSAPDARAFPEPTAHVPSFPEPQHQHPRSHNARDQVPAPSFPTPYGVPSFPEPEHHGFRPSFVDVENDADDEDSEISTIPPLPNPFDRSLPSLPDGGPGRSKPQRRATAPIPVPSTSSSHPRTPARSATMLVPGQLPTSTPAHQQPPALGAGVSESRDAIATIPSMPSPTLPPHLPQAPPAMPSHSDYVSPPIPEESSYPSPASSHSYGRSHPTYRSDTASPHMPTPYGDARTTGYPNLISSNAPPPPEKPALSTDLAKIARPQDVRPGHRVPSMPRPLASPSESERAPSAISSPPPARSSYAPTIPTMPTVGSTIGPFSDDDDDGMSWATSAEQDPPRRAKTPPAKPAPPKASAAVATAAAASNFSEPLKASTTPSAPPASPHLRPSQPVNGDAASSKYSVTSAASRPRPDRVSSKPQPAPTSLQGSGQAHPKPTAPTPSKPTSKPQPTSEPTFKPKPPPTTAAAAPAEDTPTPIRPPLNPTGGSKHIGTEYTHMLLALDAVPFVHNVAANAATWLLLAGFVVLPGTFSTLSTLTPQSGTIEATVVHAVKNIPLFVVAYVLSGVGAGGMCWLWWRWSRNYIWLLGHIFVPGALNGLAGVFSTLATVLGTQSGVFSPSAITTLAVTGATATICGVLSGWYTFFMLGRVKREHEREVGKEGTGKHGEGYIKAAKELMGAKTR